MKINLHDNDLVGLTNEEIVELFEETRVFVKNNKLSECPKLEALAKRMNLDTFHNSTDDELIKIMLFVSIKTAEIRA